MTLKIAVACMANETNGFNIYQTEIEDFHVATAEEVFTKPFWQNRSQVTGIIDQLKQNGVDVVPLYFARTLPSGTISKKAYTTIVNHIIEQLQKHTDIDAVCWALHGSFYADGIDDPEGQLLAKAHQIMPNIPFHLALDTHAKISDTLIKHSASISIYKTSPHEDYYETGQKAAQIAVDSLNNNYETFVANVPVPLLLSGEISMSDFEPTRSLVAKLHELETKDEILSANLAFAFPWVDSPLLGCHAILSGKKSNMALVYQQAYQLAQLLWDKRSEFKYAMKTMQPEHAVMLAKNNNANKPVIISDVGDNATAGGSSDRVDFLAQLIDQKVEHCLFAAIFDHNAFIQCQQTGLNKQVTLQLGRYYWTPEKALTITGTVEKFYQYYERDCCLIKIGGLWLIIGKHRIPCSDRSVIDATGLDVNQLKSIIIKCGYHGTDLIEMSCDNILALTMGDTAPELAKIPYKRVKRPIYPLDLDTTF